MKRLRVALYGCNGHQIFDVEKDKNCTLVAVAGIPEPRLGALAAYREGRLAVLAGLDGLIAREDIDLISLCSPIRAHQADDAIAVLRGGKHVYAEKPAALTAEKLDEILAVANECGKEFHEMATTAFERPLYRLKEFLKRKPIGDVVQIYVQKSYTSRFERRPQDDLTDGGLVRWVGIHAFRFIEHIVGERIASVETLETQLGNPSEGGGLCTAASCIMRLENGGVASACLNYLNPDSFGLHGNECIRVFGTRGMAEISDGGRVARAYIAGGEVIELDETEPPDFFSMYAEHLLFGKEMPFTLEEELHPLYIAIMAKENVKIK